MSATEEPIELPEARLPFELWEMYRLSDIKERAMTNEYARMRNLKLSTVAEDIKFLLACIKKLSKDKTK